jgi:hypothetical protein
VGLFVPGVVSIRTFAIGAALAKGVLLLLWNVLVERDLSPASSPRTVSCLGATIWFGSVAPTVVEAAATSRLSAPTVVR